MRVNKGRAGYVYRGEYNSETAYEKLDTVYDSNTTYQCTAPCTGKKPSENPDYWAPMCASATAVDRAAAEAARAGAETAEQNAENAASSAASAAQTAISERLSGLSLSVGADGGLDITYTY